MSKSQSLERILARVKEKEKKYDWLGAVEFYKKALDHVSKHEDFLEAGNIEERMGYCFYRAAFQAQTQEEFSRCMRLAIEAYKRASEQFEKVEKRVRNNHCKGSATWANYWIAPSYAEKKALLDECTELWKKVATDYEKAKGWFEYGKACNELLGCLLARFEIEQDWSNRREISTAAMNYGEGAIANFRELADECELTRAYYQTGLVYFFAAYYGEPEKRKKLGEKSLTYLENALELSEKIGDNYLIALSNMAALSHYFWMMGDLKLSLKGAAKVLQQSLTTKDNLLIGQAFTWLADITYWTTWPEEDPDKKRRMYETVLKYTKKAAFHFDKIPYYTSIGETCWPYVEGLALMAREVETDRKEKRVLLEKAIKAGREAVGSIYQSGPPETIAYMAKSLSKALYFLSSIENKTSERKTLLEEALRHAVKNLKVVERSFPFWYWYRGVGQYYQALILAELASIETTDHRKKILLEKAVLNMGRCIEFCTQWAEFYPQTELFAILGKYCDEFGKILNQLYGLTGEIENLQKMIEVYQGAVANYDKAEMPSRIAETYWQIAKVKDELGEQLEAAENFGSASRSYKAAAEKIPHLKEFYMDYVSYTQAWSEIEIARYHHAREEYGQAKQHYENASSLYMSSSWKYLAPNYLAWAQLEHGEELSRDEQGKKAIQAFQEAADLFCEAKRTLRVELGRIENADEKDLVKRLIKTSEIKEEYCLGRIALEEAKILDELGDHAASSGKYGLAAERFQKASDSIEHESDRQELKPIISLCRAWQIMTQAEAEASPDLYLEASQLFDEVKEYSFNEKSKLLALGHSRFCKALEAGTRFEDSRDTTLYLTATQHLESAADYYVRAGFNMASEYAIATQRLFDAYICVNNAKKEADPAKKARYYIMAEKVLQASVESYLKANHREKSEQVQRLLEKVREERQLAVSLSEVLHAPTITSSTASFVTPTPSEERAAGLERFEHANVQANLILHAKEIRAGENFDLKMQIVNVGKEVVLLAKVEEIFPADFELVNKPSYCHFEDAYLNMKGKQLDPLKTEEIRLVLRSFDKGTFEIKPRIIYVDETGHQMASEPKPVTFEILKVVLPDRITTGCTDLDSLLFGGIPENYAVILTAPSCDERDLLIRRFLEEGVKKGHITFYITTETGGVRALAEEFQSNFYLFICNPQADTIIKNLPNVFKLRGVENLTEIGIALNLAVRGLDTSISGPRRACIEIVSDVLLQHHAVQTRRWLTGLIPELRSKGFITIAVMNPQMHPPQEVQAILDLFEGEISIYEKETEKGVGKFLRIRKMYDRKYLENELSLRKERLGK